MLCAKSGSQGGCKYKKIKYSTDIHTTDVSMLFTDLEMLPFHFLAYLEPVEKVLN